ncbi:MAG: dihydroxyacetone kinase subunit L [Piscirickettsiaceae bacterium]|jgi:dihydroxyacetone kinase-like protein|nr:dihydroxyacetone kinase subunit L [Piscirickettsiaceae bacterium]
MPNILPSLIQAVSNTINDHADEVAELDRAIGDGDHVINLQRGIAALQAIETELGELEWTPALMKTGMTLMSTMGGASGSLFGTLFLSMSKAAKDKSLNTATWTDIFHQGVESVKQRGKADLGEKTMLDTLIPVANRLREDSTNGTEFNQLLKNASEQAIIGMASTKELIATKGRASFLGERAIGHIDAGARTSQLIICTICDVLAQQNN